MKPELNRISAAINQAASRGPTLPPAVLNTMTFHQPGVAHSSRLSQAKSTAPKSFSFKLEPKVKSEETEAKATVQPFPVQSTSDAPNLPRLKPASFSSHRNSINPALAMNLLKEIEAMVTEWQAELKQVLQQIQGLYLEGPIVDGWLEASPSTQSESLDATPMNALNLVGKQPTVDPWQPLPGVQYRLCGLGSDGQLWSRPCPTDQLGSVSLAIARYQKLRQLLGRKQQLETRLGQLSETFQVVCDHLKGMKNEGR